MFMHTTFYFSSVNREILDTLSVIDIAPILLSLVGECVAVFLRKENLPEIQ